MVCAVCDGSMVAVGKDYLACNHARNQGTCSNRQGVKRKSVEDVVLETLKTKLMQPHLVEEFIRAFHEEINRFQTHCNVQQECLVKGLDKTVRQLDGLYDAIADGLRTPGLQAKLENLEACKVDLEAQIANAPVPAPVLHPNLASLYRRKVAALHESLNEPDSRTEAAGLLRGLIERIRFRNLDDGFEIELVGDIVNMIEVAQTAAHKEKAASGEAT
jgi:site-specific DNA recombinase